MWLNIEMKRKYSFRLPQNSILGFKVLSSFHSTISSYILLLAGLLLNPYFGSTDKEIIAGSVFNILLNFSLIILFINLFNKRNQLKRTYFILINSLIFIFIPHILFKLLTNIRIFFHIIFY